MEESLAQTRNQIQDLLVRSAGEVSKSGASHLLSWSIPWEADALVPFLYRARGAPRIYWASLQDEVNFVGYGVAAQLTASGPRRFKKIQSLSTRLFSNIALIGNSRPAGILPRLFGGFSFNPDPDPLSLWAGFSAACFILPRYLISRYRGQIWLTVNHQLREGDDLDEILWLFTDQVEELKAELRQEGPGDPDLQTRAEQIQVEEVGSRSDWEAGISIAIRSIERGELRKLVIARSILVNSTQSIDPARALMQLGKDYQDCYRFLFEPVPGKAFFGATPELLIGVGETSAATVALAGSARRGKSAREDREIAESLLEDPKEREEHGLVVETIRESLVPFVRSVEIPESPRVRKLSNIQHLETQIRMNLKKSGSIISLVEALHPTAAVGGVPREDALRLISEVERTTRGWYASPVGWIDHRGNGLFTVAIRSAISSGNQAMLYAGAGIVRESDPEAEWEETSLKFKPILAALGAPADTNGF
ncbi:MAG TPA: isochorismate synthase [Anaerolineales bacterium]|nr:isochorismate synthase [Anaerolineales bacterium]